jgi:hypothetical protein
VDYNGNDFKALVYEFMENGDLDKWMHQDIDNENRPRHLGLLQRLNIVIDVTSALQYLHDHCEPPIIHCDCWYSFRYGVNLHVPLMFFTLLNNSAKQQNLGTLRGSRSDA